MHPTPARATPVADRRPFSARAFSFFQVSSRSACPLFVSMSRRGNVLAASNTLDVSPNMPQYMLVLRDDPSVMRNFSPEEMQKLLEKFNAWSGRMASEGRLLAGKKLMDEGGRILSKNRDRLVVKDGPFAETKEIVSGFFLIRADSYDHAVKLCDDHPMFALRGIVEIREVDFMGKPEE
jgi:hypothetical protein